MEKTFDNLVNNIMNSSTSMTSSEKSEYFMASSAEASRMFANSTDASKKDEEDIKRISQESKDNSANTSKSANKRKGNTKNKRSSKKEATHKRSKDDENVLNDLVKDISQNIKHLCSRGKERKYAKIMVKSMLTIDNNNYVKKSKHNTRLLDSGIALVMYTCYHFAYFNNLSHPKLLMLNDDKYSNNNQIYTYRESDVLHEINRIYPPFNIRNRKDVFSKIATLVANDHMSSVKNHSKLLNYIHASNGFVDMSAKNRKLIQFKPNIVTTKKINTKYISSKRYKKISSLKLIDCMNKCQLRQGFRNYQWLLNMSVSQFLKTFFNKLANNNREIIRQLWQIVLDAIESNKTRRKAVILLGNGSNGKSMFSDLLRAIIGNNNIATLTLGQIGANSSSSQNFYLQNLVNKTVDIPDDSSDNLYIADDGAFKTIVAGGVLTIPVKNVNDYSYPVSMTIIQPCNSMPSVNKISKAIYDRLLIIPFDHNFKSDNKSVPKDLLEIILNSKDVDEYVLYKAVHQPNFDYYYTSKASKDALSKYENESDKTRAFANHFLEWDISRIPVRTVYGLYRQFTMDSGNTPERASKFKHVFFRMISNKFVKKSAKYNDCQVNAVKSLDIRLHGINADDYYPGVGSNLTSYVYKDPQVSKEEPKSKDDDLPF